MCANLLNLPDFLSQCSHLTASKVPPVSWLLPGGGWTLRVWIGLIINLSGHLMSVTQHCLAINDTYFFGLSTYLHNFHVIINVMFMFRTPLFLYGYSGQQFCAQDVSSIPILKVSTPRKERGRTHMHTRKHARTHTRLWIYFFPRHF